MDELKSGIYGAYSGEHDLYFHQAPQGAELPYHVYQLITDVPSFMLGSTDKEEFIVQFSSYSEDNSSEEIDEMFEEIKTLYDSCRLSFTSWRMVHCIRELSRLLGTPGDWQYVTQYRILIERV